MLETRFPGRAAGGIEAILGFQSIPKWSVHVVRGQSLRIEEWADRDPDDVFGNRPNPGNGNRVA